MSLNIQLFKYRAANRKGVGDHVTRSFKTRHVFRSFSLVENVFNLFVFLNDPYVHKVKLVLFMRSIN